MVNDEFETPQWLYDGLNKEFNFDLDVAANSNNHKCNIWLDGKEDSNGLEVSWDKIPGTDHKPTVWMNPPYSRGQLYKWCKKAYEESRKGVTVVGLLPVDTSTKWFHEWIWDKRIQLKHEVRFLPKRLKFELNGIPQGTARFASMIVVWRGG